MTGFKRFNDFDILVSMSQVGPLIKRTTHMYNMEFDVEWASMGWGYCLHGLSYI